MPLVIVLFAPATSPLLFLRPLSAYGRLQSVPLPSISPGRC